MTVKRHALLFRLVLLLVAVATRPAWAQQPPGYQVEVIVFRNVAAGAGQPVANAPAAELSARAADPAGEPAYPLLTAGELGLNEIFQRLNRSADYRPIAQFGWRQPALARGASTAVSVPREIADRMGLVGSIRLYRQNNLYLDVALALPAGSSMPGDAAGGVSRIRELRRIRGPGLHYLDGAEFGVIAQVRPVATSVPAPTAP